MTVFGSTGRGVRSDSREVVKSGSGSPPNPPVFADLTISPNSATVGQPYNGQVSGKRSDSVLIISGAGSAGLSVDGSKIVGTPTATGKVSVRESVPGVAYKDNADLITVSAAAARVAMDSPVSSSMVSSGKLIEAYGLSRLVEGYAGNTLQSQNTDTSALVNLGFDPTTFIFNEAAMPARANALQFSPQGTTGVPLSLVAGGVGKLSRDGLAARLGTVRDANELLSRSATDGAIGVNLEGAGSFVTAPLPILLSKGGCEIHLLWSPNNRKIASNDSGDPWGGNNTQENIICFGTNSNNQMIAYMGGGPASDFCRMQAGGQQNQTSGKGASGSYRYRAKSQHVTSYVMSATSFKEIEHGKVTKSITLNAATTSAILGGSMDNPVLGIGSRFSSTSSAAQSATSRGDFVFVAVIITAPLTDEERMTLQLKMAAMGQQHRLATLDTVKGYFDELVDHRDINPATGRVTGKNSKLNTNFNVSSGLFASDYVVPGVGAKGLRSTSTGVAASYDSTDNYFADILEGSVMRLSYWESNAQNNNLAWDLSMGNAGEQTGGGYSLLLGYHHNVPTFASKPSNVLDTLPRIGTRRKADLTTFGANPYDGDNQTNGKYNDLTGHIPMSYGETISGYIWTKPTWENTDTAAPYKLDGPVYNPVADLVQYPFKPNQLQLHIATFVPEAGYNAASPDPNTFLTGTAKSYISGGGADPIGHMDGSIAKRTKVGVRHATPDHRVKSVQYQYAFQGTRCLWGFTKRQLTEVEIETIQVNLYKLLAQPKAPTTIPFTYDENTYWWDFAAADNDIDYLSTPTLSGARERTSDKALAISSNKSYQPLRVAGGITFNQGTGRVLGMDMPPSITNGKNGLYLAFVFTPATATNGSIMSISGASSTTASRMWVDFTGSRNIRLRYGAADSGTLATVFTSAAQLTLGQKYAIEILFDFDADTCTLWINGVNQNIVPTGAPWSNFPSSNPREVLIGNNTTGTLSLDGVLNNIVFQDGVPSAGIRSSVSAFQQTRQAA